MDDSLVTYCVGCGCQQCGQKTEPESQLICDECDQATHLWCLAVPLNNIPTDPEWYCDECRNESEQEIDNKRRKYLERRKSLMGKEKKHEGQKDIKKKEENKESKSHQNWGYGMTGAGRMLKQNSNNTIIKDSSATFGPIDGVLVGSWWRFRAQASECGVHAPLVAGIHGREQKGAYSLVFTAGVYSEDIDLGDDLYYTGIGGRQNSSFKKARSDSSCKLIPNDQHLTKVNKALALNCAAPFGSDGASAGSNWRDGKPVRVLRSGNNHNNSSSSLYCPPIGIRYDGLYKVVKYWPETMFQHNNLMKNDSFNGYKIWRFHLRRDDPSPAPWTEQGRYLCRKLGFQVPKYPDGWTVELAGKRNLRIDLKLIEKRSKLLSLTNEKNKNNKKQKTLTPTSNEEKKLCSTILDLINQDHLNRKIWSDILTQQNRDVNIFKTTLQETFICAVCMDSLLNIIQQNNKLHPVTLDCGHSLCSGCLEQMIQYAQAEQHSTTINCPTCRSTIILSDHSSFKSKEKSFTWKLKTNQILEKIFKQTI